MSRRTLILWLSLFLIVGIFGVLLYVLFPFIKTDIYRETLERGFSVTLGRKVSLEGPITLTFSLHPNLILEDVSIANPPWASQPHFFRADRLEIGLSLGLLLRRRLEMEKLIIAGASLSFEEGPGGLENWGFKKETKPSMLSDAMPSVFMTFAERGEVMIEHFQITHRPFPLEETTEVEILKGLVIAPDDQTRHYSFEGSYQHIPVTIEFTGGRILDLVRLSEVSWPVEGVLSIPEASAVAQGSIGGPNPARTFDLQVQIKGDRLSALNDLLKTDLPDSEPFVVSANVVPDAQGYDFNRIQGTLGASDIAGQLRIQKVDDRQKLTGHLLSQYLRIQDLSFSSSASLRGQETEQTPTPSQPSTGIFSAPSFDLDLDLSVEQCLLGEIELGSIELTTSVNQTHAEVNSARFQSFGGMVDARFETQFNAPHSQSRFEAKVRSFNYGRALRDFGMSMNLQGTTDFDVTATGNGGSWQEFLKTLTLNLQIGQTTFGFSSPGTARPLPLGVHRGLLRVSNGGPVKVVAQGVYRERAFGLRLTTDSPADLVIPENSWPVSLTAQAAGALLAVKGKFDVRDPNLAGVMAVSLKGRRLNELDPALPVVGPYFLKARVIKEGGRFEISDLQSRFGNSDLSGVLEVDFQKSRPHFMGLFTSKQIYAAELSTPGDIGIPSDAMRAIDIDFNLAVGLLRTGELDVAGLALTADLQDGRLTIRPFQGTLLDQQSTYGRVLGGLVLNATGTIPVLSGNLSLKNIRYDRIFRDVRFANFAENILNVTVDFSSSGPTIFTILDKTTLSIQGEKVRLKFHRGSDDQEPVQVVSSVRVESKNGGPLRLDVEGEFQDIPFRLRSFTGSLGTLLADRGLWPVDVSLEVPHAKMEMNGHFHLPLAMVLDEFSFQMVIKGNNLRDWNFLTGVELPAVGPVDLKAALTRSPVGFHIRDFEGVLGENRWQGDITVMTKWDRPRVRGKLVAESLALGGLNQPPIISSTKNEHSKLEEVTDSMKAIGANVIDSLSIREKPKVSQPRTIPDFTFPVEALRAFDLFLDGEIKHVRTERADLGHVVFQATLDQGALTVNPLTGNLWKGDFEGKVNFDGTQYVPTLEVGLKIHGLEYAEVAKTFGATDLVKGQSQSIKLILKGRGDTLSEVLERAQGELEWVDGPLQLATRYIDLWAADLITTALTTAWQEQPVTNLNCVVGYFDLEEGILKSDNILIDSTRVTVAGLGKLNLMDERLDLVLTPRPKDPSLFSLAHTVRITGPLSNPDVTSDKFRIAESGAWGLLGLVNPFGFVVVIPQIAGTTIGTMVHNPCVEAMKGRPQTVQALDEIKSGLWGKIKRFFPNP